MASNTVLEKPKISKRTWSDEFRYYARHLNIMNAIILLGAIPTYFTAILHVPLRWETFLLTGVFYLAGGMGITAGYHRLWSHKSYKASTPLRYWLAIMGAGQWQWSILWWAKHHRSHHRYTDTEQDPYNPTRGFFFSHVGWLVGYNPKSWGKVDLSDLLADPVVVWQHKWGTLVGFITAVLFPVLIAHFGWNDARGALVHTVLGRLMWIWHLGFFVNSIAHLPWFGSQPYSDKHSARNVLLFAWVLAGEASHNFHHTFPADYRNGLHWYEGDLSRWFIRTCERLGLAWDLHITSPAEIERARQRQINIAEGIAHGPEIAELPEMEWQDFVEQAAAGRYITAVHGIIYDVTDFMADHPGGPELVQQYIGKDATVAFYDEGSHVHSPYAETLLGNMRVAVTRRQEGFKEKKTD
ncbi:stearic acid desaturase [Penicillium frequentans]|uniref:Acyl-CoA desaturase n=1 Tax=Penicillium frequentans TaxID=3151616 RepID=A0AAD6CMK6_9EURO|nr:stearic acid desaturase [Penicillium glabrum]